MRGVRVAGFLLVAGLGFMPARAAAQETTPLGSPPPPVATPTAPATASVPWQKVALGLMLGEPSGVTLKFVNPRSAQRAWEAGLGWSQSGKDGLDVHAQHQWHLVEMLRSSRGLLTFYVGAGGRVKAVDGTRFGLRGSAGINYLVRKSPRRWEGFLEVAPIQDLTPDTELSWNGIGGFRVYF